MPVEETENQEVIDETPETAEEMVTLEVPSTETDEYFNDDLDTETPASQEVTDPISEPVVEATPEPVKTDLDTFRELLADQNTQHANDMKALVEALKPKAEVAPVLTEEQRYKQHFDDETAKRLAASGLAGQSEVAGLKAEIAELREQNQVTAGQRQVTEIERPHIEALHSSGLSAEEVIEVLAEKAELVKIMSIDPAHADKLFTLARAEWSKKRDKKTATATSAARAEKAQLQEQAGVPSSNGGAGSVTVSKARMAEIHALKDNDPEAYDRELAKLFGK